MAESRRTKVAQREATIQKLIMIAREQFGAYGYAHTATEEVVHLAGVTRGALYHHFESKEGLFRAVVEAVQQDVNAQVQAAAEQQTDLWNQLLAGCTAFLRIGLNPSFRQILLIDAPVVLGWETWRQFDDANSMQSLRQSLSALMQSDQIVVMPLEALTHLLSGAMNEGALWIAQSADPDTALHEADAVLQRLLNSLRR
ncbi:MAG: TetR/AcrR family transcriptional regulator [Anaerolineae bacterium]|nr:TetR/AcrR family transcriptional regulator [Anaerolineae bacterium]